MLSEPPTVLSPDAPRIERGPHVPADASLAVVVMAIDGDERAAAALASLLAQDAPIEIVVVNTGGVSLRPRIAQDLDRIVLVEAGARRLPGGTRNLGIAATTAPVVAFLAADCLASPGWAAQRLAAHARGNRAVASALRPAPDASGRVSSASWATYALLHVRRAPEFPEERVARYGVSYDRSLFAEHGLFRDDLRIGEDSEFNERIAGTAPLAWAPEVITLHRYPVELRQGLREAFDRGAHLYRWFATTSTHPVMRSLRRVIGNWIVAMKLASMTTGETSMGLRRASPMILALALAYACGSLAAWAAPGRTKLADGR
jgi:glycosyltransferase involved in cell wall biosynthesis